jgi:hypothetical protein
MKELEIQLPNMWDGIDLPAILEMKSGRDRSQCLREIVIETLRAVGPAGTYEAKLTSALSLSEEDTQTGGNRLIEPRIEKWNY